MVNFLKLFFRLGFWALILIIYGSPQITIAQEISDEKIKPAITYQFAQNIIWPNEQGLDTFRIAVYSDNQVLYNEFNEISKVKFLRRKPISVYQIKQVDKIKTLRYNILYIDKKFNEFLTDIFETLSTKPVLIITEESTLKEYIMINFIYLDGEKSKISYEVNRNAIEQEHNLSILPKLLLLGGSRLEVANLYEKQEEKLKNEQEKVERYKQEIEKQRAIVESQYKEIIKQKDELQKQKKEIDYQLLQIYVQKTTLDTLFDEISQQQQLVNDNSVVLKKNKEDIFKQQKTISIQVQEMNERNQILELQKLEIQNQQGKIKNQVESLSAQEKMIQTQKKFLVLSVSSVILAICLIFLIFLGYRNKQKANTILQEKNFAIEQQEAEIEKQAAQIELANWELEKQNHILEETVQIRTEEYRLAKERAEEADKLKSAFLTNMSHEIRTPLNAIVGFSQLLSAQTDIKEEIKGYFDIIKQSSNELLRLINDIIDIAKIESGQVQFSITDYNLQNMFDALYSFYQEQIVIEGKQDKVRLIYTPDKSIQPLIIRIDPYRIKQVLINLLSNALKFTDSGSIEFGYKLNENDIIFFVTDTGIGIPQQFHKNVFQRFRKIDQGSHRLYSGTGLGLVISKSLVELHRGTIWFESIPQQGTSFFFKIPLIYGKPIKEEFPFLKSSVRSFSKKTVLICEDDNNSRELLRLHLTNLNFNIISAKDGVEAVEKFKAHPNIDLILLDIQMPRLNGYDTLTQIRKISNKKIPIVAQTAFAMTHEIKRIMDSGFDDYISKPIILENLVDIISKRM